MQNTYITHSPVETIGLAKRLIEANNKPLWCFRGNLGAGKTTFIKGIAEGMGITEAIQSPTFQFLRVYGEKSKLYHFDLYRTNDHDEHAFHELSETLQANDGMVMVEWSERIEKFLPKDRLDIVISLGIDENERTITVVTPD